MPTKHTVDYILKELNEDTKPENISKLYQRKYVNYSGKVLGGKEYYFNVIAEDLLNRLKHENIFEKVIPISRNDKDKDYIVGHKPLNDNEKYRVLHEIRGEEWYAKSLMNSILEPIGKIIDYQIPIKSSESNNEKGIGKVDLLAYREDIKVLSFVELKREYNEETILRAILEITTYYQQIKRNELKDELERKYGYTFSKEDKKVVLVFKDSRQEIQYLDKDSEPIRQLAEKLSVNVLVLNTKVAVLEAEIVNPCDFCTI